MPCTPRMRVRRDDQPGSGCASSCGHRAMVEAWREARDAWERRRDDWSVGYATERREYAERTGDHPPDFGDWLRSWSSSYRHETDSYSLASSSELRDQGDSYWTATDERRAS